MVKLQKKGSCSTEPQDFSKAMNNSNNTNERKNSDCNESSGCRCDFKVHVIVIIVASVEFVIIIFMIIRSPIQRARKQRRKQNKEKKLKNGDDDSIFPMAEIST